MTIRISFSDKIVRVAVEIDGKIESAITELPQRPWVGLTDEDKESFWRADQMTGKEWDELFDEVENKLRSKNT